MLVRLVKGEDSILRELLGDLLDGREHAKGLEVDGEDVFEFLIVGVSLTKKRMVGVSMLGDFKANIMKTYGNSVSGHGLHDLTVHLLLLLGPESKQRKAV